MEMGTPGREEHPGVKGAMGALDSVMATHDLDGRGVWIDLHHFLVAGRTHYPETCLLRC